MNQSRVDLLRATLTADPGNAFVRYALALELARYGDPAEAWQHFEHLLNHDPEYSATYYQAGMFLAKQGRSHEAQQVFTKGIGVTSRQGNLHAQSELQAALEELQARRQTEEPKP